MGRRIPGKKHRGVKDPLLQKEIRDEGIKHLINAPPKDIDFQEIPKSLERIMKLKQLTKEGVFNKQKKKIKNKGFLMDTSKIAGKEKIVPGMTKPDREVPVLVQRPGEPDSIFLHRVKCATNKFIKHVNFELEHNMTMKVDKKTGQVSFEKAEIDPVDKMFQEKLMATKGQKRKKNANAQLEGLSKTARRRMKLQAKMADRGQAEGEVGRVDDFSRLQDKVEFNEIVHRPPQFSVLPRKAEATDIARRPGSKPGLLLTQLLEPSGKMNRDLTGRRKDLSASDRRRLDSAQTAAVQAYRQIKASRAATSVR